MKHLIHMLALTLSIGASQAMAESYSTGMRDFTVKDARKDRKLEGLLWYPAAPDARLHHVHKNGVWVGVEIAKKAPMAQGRYPLVVLSHGMYGNARNQNWLADALVKEGYIVATLNHPGTSTWLRDTDDARTLWERAKDISRIVTHVLKDPLMADQIDADRIFMGGHSLGGMTAVHLAGGRYDPALIDAICETDPGELICEITEMWHLARTPEDRAALSQDLSDPRIKAVAVLDLGGTQTFSAQSLGAITTPMLVIGAPKDIKGSLDLDRESRALVAQLPESVVSYIEPETLSHFDFLGTCTPKAVAILEDEVPGDGYICFDGTRERIANHAIVVNAMLDFFARY